MLLLAAVAAAVVAVLIGATPHSPGQTSIALWKCKEYHDAALFWAKLRGEPPARLSEMEVPLDPGELPFIEQVDDPWGNPYLLERAGTDVRIRCIGPDGQVHTKDDIVYPEERR